MLRSLLLLFFSLVGALFVSACGSEVGDTSFRIEHDFTTVLASVAADGAPANGPSGEAAISGDGRFVAFSSLASNLTSGDTNGVKDVFVRDLSTGTTRRVSVASGGAQGNSHSGRPAINADGRYIAYVSAATNLVPSDTNSTRDVFVYDQQTRETRRVSVASDGAQGNGFSGAPSIGGDGRFVAFESSASSLVPGDGNNNTDVFVRDLMRGWTDGAWKPLDPLQHLVSGAPSISANGRLVAFAAHPPDWAVESQDRISQVLIRDRQSGHTALLVLASESSQGKGISGAPSLSANGLWVSLRSNAPHHVTDATNSVGDVLVYGRETGSRELVSVDSEGNQGNDTSGDPSTSGDGRYIAFWSDATNLVPRDSNGNRDAFVRDRKTGQVLRLSRGLGLGQADGATGPPAISSDGRFVAFQSGATNLVAGDTNGHPDVFVVANRLFESGK